MPLLRGLVLLATAATGRWFQRIVSLEGPKFRSCEQRICADPDPQTQTTHGHSWTQLMTHVLLTHTLDAIDPRIGGPHRSGRSEHPNRRRRAAAAAPCFVAGVLSDGCRLKPLTHIEVENTPDVLVISKRMRCFQGGIFINVPLTCE